MSTQAREMELREALRRVMFSYPAKTCHYTYFEGCPRCESQRFAREVLAKTEQPTPSQDGETPRDEPCYLCHELTNSLAGNPSKWPMSLPYAGGNGKRRHYCMGCVIAACDGTEPRRAAKDLQQR